MPEAELHLEQYNHNKKLLSISDLKSDTTTYLDWALTILFYCAVHLIEKELSKENKHTEQHGDRTIQIAHNKKLSEIATQYKTLMIQSRRARYDCRLFTTRERFTPDDLKLAYDCLGDIELTVLHSA